MSRGEGAQGPELRIWDQTHHLRDSKNHHIGVLVETGLRKGRRGFNVGPRCLSGATKSEGPSTGRRCRRRRSGAARLSGPGSGTTTPARGSAPSPRPGSHGGPPPSPGGGRSRDTSHGRGGHRGPHSGHTGHRDMGDNRDQDRQGRDSRTTSTRGQEPTAESCWFNAAAV